MLQLVNAYEYSDDSAARIHPTAHKVADLAKQTAHKGATAYRQLQQNETKDT